MWHPTVHLIPMATITEWLAATFSEIESLIKAAVIIAILGLIGWKVLISKGALTALISVAVVGVCLWYFVIGSGLEDFGKMLQGQGNANQ